MHRIRTQFQSIKVLGRITIVRKFCRKRGESSHICLKKRESGK